MIRRRLALAAIRVIVALVFAELLSLTVYYYQTGHLFYLFRKTYETLPGTGRQPLTVEGLHPYFGPTHRPGHPFDIPPALRRSGAAPARLATNNFGFVSAYDYPFPKTDPRQFVVGLFGGSVGVWFCQVGAPQLAAELKGDPFFRDRDIVPLCFSHEGYKQPQQLLLLSYFLSIGQTFDLVVNIDGFNEVALGSMNAEQGADISMPSPPHLRPLVDLVNASALTPEKLRSLAAIGAYKDRLNTLAVWLRDNDLASVNLVLEQLYKITSARYHAERMTFSQLPPAPTDASLIQVTAPVRARDAEAVFDDIAAQWAHASTLMHQLLAPRNVPYVHVLQPNQYFTSRRFTEQEARVALSDASPFKAGAARGYPALLRHATALRETTHFLDATHLFDDEPAAVYIDDCCHYTLRGYDLLAELIGRAVLRSRGPWSTQ